VLYVPEAALRVTARVNITRCAARVGRRQAGILSAVRLPVLAKAGGWPEFTAVYASSLDDPKSNHRTFIHSSGKL